MRSLVLTALTAISAIGRGAAATLAAVQDRRTGLRPSDFGSSPRGWIGRVEGVEQHRLPAGLDAFDCRNNRLADLALHTDGFAASVATAAARYGAGRIAVVIGTSTSGVLSAEGAFADRQADGALPAAFDYDHTHDMFSAARFVRTVLNLRGPALVVSTACASSAKSFLDAQHLIESGVCDAAVVGGVDTLCRMTLDGFASLDLISPTPCRPGDAARTGISIGEAAGFALLEREGPWANGGMRLLGGGATSDGYHMSSPHPDGAGAIGAMRLALDRAGLRPSDIDYVNLHGTGTRANDAMEDIAVAAMFGPDTPCSSTKGWTGHTLGACGILEAVIAGQCMAAGFAPGALAVEQVDPAFRSRVLMQNTPGRMRTVASNAFGFGGINCCLIFGAG